MRLRLGQEMASEIERHVDVALGRIQADAPPNPIIMTKREFYELLALEQQVEEIERRINAVADSDHDLPSGES